MKYSQLIKDHLILSFTRAFLGVLGIFPLSLRIVIMTSIIEVVLFFNKKYKHYARVNLKIVYPDQDQAWREELLKKSYQSLARLLVDFGRLHKIDGKWIEQHVEFPDLERLKQIKAANSGKGIILATGHLGSFELLGHAFVHYIPPISIVVRPFTLPKINSWWNQRRSAWGRLNVIDRAGAFREILQSIRDGYSTGILFDQHVRVQHAIYVDFFGKPAATTRIIALVALRTGAPVVTVGFRYKGNDKYQIFVDHCQIDDVRNDSEMDKETKVREITSRVSASYEGLIRQYPEGWFWLHRRWKTVPGGEKGPIYK